MALDPQQRADFDVRTRELRAEQILQIAEDDLRRRILEDTPELAEEARALTKLLRESVELDRAQFLNKTGATVEELDAWARSEAHLHNDPPFSQWLAAYRSGRLKKGVLQLYPNKTKNRPSQPHFIGRGYVEAHSYTVMAWIEDNHLRIVLNQESGDA